jgi:peptide-methionine (S)-S-oxide reductase
MARREIDPAGEPTMDQRNTSMRTSLVWVAASAVVFCAGTLATLYAEDNNVKNETTRPTKSEAGGPTATPTDQLEQATFGTGCFWCTEAVFEQLRGVKSVESGYTGGNLKDPTYEQICSGLTGHAEVVQITYDPKTISYAELLEVFWKSHDPTTLNRQGNDVGTQYRSAVFYHNEAQRQAAEHYKQKLDESGAFSGAIVTEITPLAEYYPAEKYHQDYYRSNPTQGYCSFVIRPKVEKVREVFADKLEPAAGD